MKKYLIFFFILIIGFLVLLIYFPKTPSSEDKVVFSIARGEGSQEIALNLQKAGLIRSALIFRVYVLALGMADKLQAGSYLLSPSMNIPKVATKIAKGEVLSIRLTMSEGVTLRQVEEWLGLELENQKINLYKKDYDFLQDAPDELSLEGYLFPDTYWLNFGVSGEELIRKMLDNFGQKLAPELREEIKRQKKKIFEIVIVASLIEREVKTKEDRELVSGILWKRLKAGIPLQVDATISYITGKQTARISIEETQIDSPYNTYKYAGLPRGPIANPGLESILAAIYPKDSPYWYYLSTPDGQTIFSKTLEEHNIAKAKYLK